MAGEAVIKRTTSSVNSAFTEVGNMMILTAKTVVSAVRRVDVGAGVSGEGAATAARLRRWFVQMKGTARLSGRIRGSVVSGEGTGFFETYR